MLLGFDKDNIGVTDKDIKLNLEAITEFLRRIFVLINEIRKQIRYYSCG